MEKATQLFYVQTGHGTLLAVYCKTGALCSVDPDALGLDFTPIVCFCPEPVRPTIAYLLLAEPGPGFFCRPFEFRTHVLPLEIGKGEKPDQIAFSHPGSPHSIKILCAEAPLRNQHFGRVVANRAWVGGWESLELVKLPAYFVSAYAQNKIRQIEAYAKTHAELLDAYAHFSDDCLAALPQTRHPTSLLDMLGRFESLGTNCEFGFVQRHCGLEQMGLLRFAGGLGARNLAHAIRARFEGFGELHQLQATYHPKSDLEVYVDDLATGLNYHTWRQRRTELDQICREESQKLGFLKAKLLEDFEDAEKIFVFSTRGGTKEEDVDDLFDAMREIGPVTLLSVVEADLDHPAGTVLELRDGFLRGFIGAFSQDPWDPPLQAWLRICRNAIARITK